MSREFDGRHGGSIDAMSHGDYLISWTSREMAMRNGNLEKIELGQRYLVFPGIRAAGRGNETEAPRYCTYVLMNGTLEGTGRVRSLFSDSSVQKLVLEVTDVLDFLEPHSSNTRLGERT